MRGPVAGIPALLQPVAHALIECTEEARRVTAPLTIAELWRRPADAASCGYHLLHAAGSLDRLFTYARGEMLDEGQRAALAREAASDREDDAAALLARFESTVQRAFAQLETTPESSLTDAREVGRAKLPSTVLGLLFHAAEHTQRHIGQLTTTARIVQGKASDGGRSTVDIVRVLILRELRSLRREVERYTSDEALWRVVPGIANPGGTLVLHLAGNLQHYIGARLGQTGYVRDRDAEFSRRDVPRAALLAEVDHASAAVDKTLAGLDERVLDQEYPELVGAHPLPTRDFLLHLVSHLAYHLGQVDYHRRITGADSATAGTIPLKEILPGSQE
jgi:uncharacterized damage-inducible protein DinB